MAQFESTAPRKALLFFASLVARMQAYGALIEYRAYPSSPGAFGFPALYKKPGKKWAGKFGVCSRQTL